MLEFIPLSSGSSGNCYVVRSDNHPPLLIDPGVSFSELQRKLWEVGINVSDCGGALCSHHHQDHAKAVLKLMMAGVDVWASHEAWDGMRFGFSSHHRKHIVKPQRPFYVPPLSDKPESSWRVQGFSAVHDSEGTLGFLIDEMNGGNLLFLTDSAFSPFRFEGLTHIAIECNHDPEILKQNVMAGRLDINVGKRSIETHMSLPVAIELLKANDLSKVEAVYLMHLSRANSDWRDFKDQVQRATGCCVYVCAENGGIEE